MNTCYIPAATPTAPAPSAMSFCFSMSASMAAAISSSVTVTTSSTYCSKVEATKRLGAEVRLVKGAYDDAYDYAHKLQDPP